MMSPKELASSRGGGTGQNDELQELVEAWSHRIGRSVAIDDMNVRMLAVSAHFGDEDPARVTAVMKRGLDTPAVEHLRRHGVTELDSPAWVPGNEDLGLYPRFIVPIRHHGVPLGFLALVDRDQNLSQEAMDQGVEAARDAGVVLYRRLVLRERVHNQFEAIMRDLFSADEAARLRAAQEIHDEEFVTRSGSVAVLVVRLNEAPTHQGIDRDGLYSAIERCVRAEPRGTTLFVLRGRQIAVLLAGLAPDSRLPGQLASRLLAATDSSLGSEAHCTIGVGRPVASIAHSHKSYTEACLAAHACSMLSTLPRISTWEDLGVYATLMSLPVGDLSARMIPDSVRRLQQHKDAENLLETAEVFLDCAGDSRITSERLYIHRSSLYARLARIEKTAGVDLGDGRDRLSLHLGIKLARLLEAYRLDDPGPVGTA
ncbi:PucR family transcriptional regulator [Rhodococcus sp. NPDC056960]|uniref:PucR family transcriptional regulator n=1 Tax=Rhodococcus sp. NPDC056960 TaxID=3345982 RepID=UPI003637D5DD